MVFAVFSASILRPVEPSRMVNRSPSSFPGLCSGAGIPPVWTHTHDNWHHSSGRERKKKPTVLSSLTGVYKHATAASGDGHVPPSPAKHKHKPTPSTPVRNMAERKRGCRCFKGCDSANRCHMELK